MRTVIERTVYKTNEKGKKVIKVLRITEPDNADLIALVERSANVNVIVYDGETVHSCSSMKARQARQLLVKNKREEAQKQTVKS